jgi:hypothetical protein
MSRAHMDGPGLHELESLASFNCPGLVQLMMKCATIVQHDLEKKVKWKTHGHVLIYQEFSEKFKVSAHILPKLSFIV